MNNNYKKKNFSGRGKRSSGRNQNKNNKWEHHDRNDRPTMHSATCASCGVNCEVPFRPNGRKPVFCSDCFNNEEHEVPKTRFHEQRSERRSSFDKPYSRSGGNDEVVAQLKSLNIKLDKIVSAITELVEGDYSEDDFDREERTGEDDFSEIDEGKVVEVEEIIEVIDDKNTGLKFD